MRVSRRHGDWCGIGIECVQSLGELREFLQHHGTGGDCAAQCRQLRFQGGDHVGQANAQREFGADRAGVTIGHAREFQRKLCQSNTRPSSVPSATTKAIRSSGGRLNATSNGTPFRTR